MRHFLKKKYLKKSDSRRRGMELDGSVYAEWYMNKNIQSRHYTIWALTASGWLSLLPWGEEDPSESAQFVKTAACFKHRSLEILCKVCELLYGKKYKSLHDSRSNYYHQQKATDTEAPTRRKGLSAQSRLFCGIFVPRRY